MSGKILFLSRWFPYPADNGSKLRISGLLRGLSRQYGITLLSFVEPAKAQPALGPLTKLCHEVHTVAYAPFNPRSGQARLGFLSATPRSVIHTYSPAMDRAIRAALERDQYDLIIASQIDMAVYWEAFAGVPAVFEEVELGVMHDQFARAATLMQRLRYGLTWGKYRRYVGRLLRHFDICTVVSETEKSLLHAATSVAAPSVVIPNCVEVADYVRFAAEEPAPATLVFTGSLTFDPNYRAMCWFISEVLPYVQRAIPGVKLTITGDPGERVLPAAAGVTLSGFVPDVRPVVARAWASVVPIHEGGGTRLKILESMALETPVVSTTKGAEGLDVAGSEHLLLADDPVDFAEAVIRLLGDRELRERLAKNAAERVRERYDWGRTVPEVLALVGEVIATERSKSSSLPITPT